MRTYCRHRHLVFPFLVLLITTLWMGCSQAGSTVLGQTPQGTVQSIASIKTASKTSPVTIRGIMFEKCPAAGCWFMLRDATGVVKVDTKMAGFVVVKVPLQATLTVTGKIGADGDETIVGATGLRY